MLRRDVLCGLQLSGAPGQHAHVERRITWPASWRLGRESTNFERQQRAPFADDDAVGCTFSLANSDSSLFVIRFGGAGNESVPIQLALCCFPGLALSNAKIEYIFQIKYTAATISNSTRKLLWFEITKMVIVVLKNKCILSFVVIFGTLAFSVALRGKSAADAGDDAMTSALQQTRLRPMFALARLSALNNLTSQRAVEE